MSPAEDTGSWDLARTAAAEPPLRVAYVVHEMEVAGAQILVAETIRRLGRALDPVILCLDEIGAKGEELRALGVRVTRLGRRPGIDLRAAVAIAREVRAGRVTLVHAHQYTPFFYAALARLLLGPSVRLILTEHGRHYPDRVSARRRWINRLVLGRLASAVTACSEFSRGALASVDGFPRERIEVIPNGVRVGDYGGVIDPTALRRRLGLDPSRRYVAAVGRLHPVKDHTTLLRAFREVALRRPDVDLLLVGDGPLRSELEAATRQLAIADRVRFFGVRSDVPEILRAVDLFSLTSLSEAASLTLLEALASGLPVVVTAVGGNPEIARHGIEGLLVPRRDAAAAASAILELLDDPERARALGRAGRRRVEEQFRLERTVDRYFRLYLELCPPDQRPSG